jgi:hypothetical protein
MMASHEKLICKVNHIDKRELKEIHEKYPHHKVEPNVPDGLKVAKDTKDIPDKPDLEYTQPAAKKPLKTIVERFTAQIPPTEFPYSAIGVLFVGADSDMVNPTGRGTAAVVGIANMIVTAATVIPANAPGGWWARFVPGYHDGIEPYGSAMSRTCHGNIGSIPTSNSNYVVMKLDWPIGEKCGILGAYYSTDSDSYLAYQNWDTVGYSNETPLALLGLPIERDDLSNRDRKVFEALWVEEA